MRHRFLCLGRAAIVDFVGSAGGAIDSRSILFGALRGAWCFVAIVCAAACGDGAGRGADRPSNRPNVVIVLADDLGYADVGSFGAQGFSTPSLDRLAAEGVRFTNFYAAAPICSPSRAALLTGSYPARIGVTDVLMPDDESGLNPAEVTIAELLKPLGYATAAVGKWHLGDAESFLPTRQGFDEFFGLPYSHDMAPLPLLENEEAIEYEPDLSQLTERYTERAKDFITRNRERPFLLYFAHSMPHIPLAVSDDFAGRSEQGLYGDVVTELDWSVGELLDTLDELGVARDTLVLFTSDNGPWLAYGNHAGSSGPLREGKWTTFEGGQRVPGIVRWPRRADGNVVSNEIVSALDLFPTVLTITGALPPAWPIDGKSMLPILEGASEAANGSEPVYFYYYLGVELQAVRNARWKLHFAHSYKTAPEPGADGERGSEEYKDIPVSLFDLDADPGETTNLAADHPDLVTQLTEAATAFDTNIKENLRPAGQR